MDKGSSFKGNKMIKQIEEYKIKPEHMAPENHQANRVEERTIQEVNRRMNIIGPDEWRN